MAIDEEFENSVQRRGRWLHGPLKDPYLVVQYGEQLGLGTRDYELIDVLPVEKIERAPMGYIPAQ